MIFVIIKNHLNVVEIHLCVPVISLLLHERAEWTNLEGDVVKVLYIIGCVFCEFKVDLWYIESQLHFNSLLYFISETWRGRCRTLHGAQMSITPSFCSYSSCSTFHKIWLCTFWYICIVENIIFRSILTRKFSKKAKQYKKFWHLVV
jgi:membrane protease YdiL (CAAX protease family)